MTTPQFIKRIYTMLQVNDTALIIPLFADDNTTHVAITRCCRANARPMTWAANFG